MIFLHHDILKDVKAIIFHNCFRFMIITFLLYSYSIFLTYLQLDFLPYPIMPSPIFFLSQLTTFTHHMTHSLISLFKQPTLVILLSLIYLCLNCICYYCSFLCTITRALVSLFRHPVSTSSTDLQLLFFGYVKETVHVVAFLSIPVSFHFSFSSCTLLTVPVINNHLCCSYQPSITLSHVTFKF